MTKSTRTRGALDLDHLRLRALLDGMLDPVITIDGRGLVVEASRSVQAVFGYTPEELIGRNVNLLIPEPHHSAHDGYLANYRRTGKTHILGSTREFEVLHKGGAVLSVELSVSRVDPPGHEDPLFIGSFRDITARKRAENALRESERRVRAIFDQEFEFVGLLDTNGVVLEINQAALTIAGLERHEVIGKHFWDTCWWDYSPQAQERLRAATERAAGGEFVRYETEYLGRAKTRIAVDFSLKPVLDEQGKVVLLLPEGRDITLLKQAQKRETGMLRALATIGESASILAHEIKNPITSVNLALRAVADQLGEDHKVVLQDLAQRMERLEKTMRRTLYFTRPLQVTLEACAAPALLAEVVQELRPQLEQAGVSCTLREGDTLPTVFLDRGLISEVFTNLVRNALEALEEGGNIVITASQRRSCVLVDVEDDGPGVAESLQATLFKPFVSTKAGGTGLGLALCKKIVEEHGGTIEVARSKLGGARFRVQLPTAPLAEA